MRVVGHGRPAEYTVNNGSNCMAALFLQKRVHSHFRVPFLMMFESILDTFRDVLAPLGFQLGFKSMDQRIFDRWNKARLAMRM